MEENALRALPYNYTCNFSEKKSKKIHTLSLRTLYQDYIHVHGYITNGGGQPCTLQIGSSTKISIFTADL